MKNLITLICLALGSASFGQVALGDVVGIVVSADSLHEPIVGAKPYIDDNNGSRYYAITDVDGSFRISAVPSGQYKMNIIYMGDTLKEVAVNVPIDGYDNLGEIMFESGFQEMMAIDVPGYDPNRIRLVYGELPVPEMTAKEIARSPVKFDMSSLVAGMDSGVKRTDDGELVFRGARKGDMIYMIDGIKSREISQVPSVAIGRVKVYSGGLPAKYGDTLGGVVVMETKSYFDLYRAWMLGQGTAVQE